MNARLEGEAPFKSSGILRSVRTQKSWTRWLAALASPLTRILGARGRKAARAAAERSGELPAKERRRVLGALHPVDDSNHMVALLAACSREERNSLVLSMPRWKRLLFSERLRQSPTQWQSYDGRPWRHPWLTAVHLKRLRATSDRVLADAHAFAADADASQLRFGFVGNIANALYVRAVPLRRLGLHVTQFLHPQDHFALSDPAWEEFDGAIEGDEFDVRALRSAGVALPFVSDVVRTEQDESWQEIHSAVRAGEEGQVRMALQRYPFLDLVDLLAFESYLSVLPTLDRLQQMDALLVTQSVQIAYLAKRPYLATQNGGDLWFEASRGDALGILQRRGFAGARALLINNPWTCAHARRFGFSHGIYLPLMLDEDAYAPGAPRFRAEWMERSGGDFFVLATSRLDQETKGSQIVIDGFRRFAPRYPGARLVVVNWGRDRARLLEHMRDAGLAERVLVLPLSGKRRLVDCYRSADCVLDQFVLGQYGATALEAMACARPVVMRLELAQYEALCDTGAPPVLEADGAEGVAAHLATLHADAAARRVRGDAARAWFLANHSGRRWAADYAALLIATALGHRFDFKDSPLGEPLSAEEVAYHAAELANAPSFPTYRVGS